MKVILLKNIAKKGKKYEVVDISSGYARNYLIPQGWAVVATTQELKKVNKAKKQEQSSKQSLMEDFGSLKSKLEKKTIKIQKKANKEGKLFGSLNEKDIKENLLRQGVQVPEDFEIVMEKPLKTLGKHNLEIIYDNKKIPLKINIQEVQKQAKKAS